MAWYQVFEYAISHWLQKATEHVFGCVLCSPGCFSLFRASALVDLNVMQKYTTKPSEVSLVLLSKQFHMYSFFFRLYITCSMIREKIDGCVP